MKAAWPQEEKKVEEHHAPRKHEEGGHERKYDDKKRTDKKPSWKDDEMGPPREDQADVEGQTLEEFKATKKLNLQKA